jgi:hypothetical protein
MAALSGAAIIVFRALPAQGDKRDKRDRRGTEETEETNREIREVREVRVYHLKLPKLLNSVLQ